jgi:hypothetical protein
MKFLMSAACSIEGGEGEGAGRLAGAGSVSSFRIDEGSEVLMTTWSFARWFGWLFGIEF